MQSGTAMVKLERLRGVLVSYSTARPPLLSVALLSRACVFCSVAPQGNNHPSGMSYVLCGRLKFVWSH